LLRLPQPEDGGSAVGCRELRSRTAELGKATAPPDSNQVALTELAGSLDR